MSNFEDSSLILVVQEKNMCKKDKSWTNYELEISYEFKEGCLQRQGKQKCNALVKTPNVVCIFLLSFFVTINNNF